MNITSHTKLCLIIGDPVGHSLSPQMHNAGYKALGIDNEFVYAAARVKPEHLQEAIAGIRAMHIRGVTVTIPHKVAVMKYLDEIDETAQKIGAVNTIVNTQGILKGSNTDWIGVVDAIEKVTALKGKSVALVGAGGAARAALYGVSVKGAKVKIFNRTKEKAEQLAKDFSCEYGLLSDLQEVQNMDIIINLTPVSLENKSLIPKEYITNKHIVFDAVYVPYETVLLQEAKEKGAILIHGTDWLLYQGVAQFSLYTGKKAPKEIMEKAILQNLSLV